MQSITHNVHIYHLHNYDKKNFSQKIDEMVLNIIVSHHLNTITVKPVVINSIVEVICVHNDDTRMQSYNQKYLYTLEKYYQDIFLIPKTSNETNIYWNFKTLRVSNNELHYLFSFLRHRSLIHYLLTCGVESYDQKVLSTECFQGILYYHGKMVLCLRMFSPDFPSTDLDINNEVVNTNILNITVIHILRTKILFILTNTK